MYVCIYIYIYIYIYIRTYNISQVYYVCIYIILWRKVEKTNSKEEVRKRHKSNGVPEFQSSGLKWKLSQRVGIEERRRVKRSLKGFWVKGWTLELWNQQNRNKLCVYSEYFYFEYFQWNHTVTSSHLFCWVYQELQDCHRLLLPTQFYCNIDPRGWELQHTASFPRTKLYISLSL